MYGFVNYAIELLVLQNFGEEVWKKIKKQADLDMDGQFLVRQIYDDSITYDIVTAAEKVLEVPASDILEMFGKMFLDFCQESGYDRILRVLGATTRDFLQNLDALHDHLGTIYPGMTAPSFRCSTRKEDGAIILHYYSERPGLECIVIGIVKAVAKNLHGMQVQVEIYKCRKELGDHVQFLIKEEAETSNHDICDKSDDEAENHDDTESYISPMTFCNVFPFHIMFDRNMKIHQAGSSIARILPQMGDGDRRVPELFTMVRPHMDFTFDTILAHINTVYILETVSGDHEYYEDMNDEDKKPENDLPVIPEHYNKLRLKGQMIYVPETDLMMRGLYLSDIPIHDATRDLVLLSEQFEAEYKLTRDLEVMNDKLQSTYRELENEKKKTDGQDKHKHSRRGLYLSDIPIHDATRDLVLLSEQFEAEYKLTRDLEVMNDKLQSTYRELENEKKKTDGLLYSVLPPTVANELRHGRPVPPRKFPKVTLLFSGIVGFSDLCALNSESTGARIVVDILNRLYSAIDSLTESDKHKNIYKVETVGDKYMAVSGLPEPCDEHAKCIAKLSLDMVRVAEGIMTPTGQSLKLTIGIHSGEVVTGVIGLRTPRYCLFGNTVNLTSRTETTGEPGVINVSEDAYGCLQEKINIDRRFKFTYRGPVNMKGKSTPMKVWILSEEEG
ncbi:unnamed protein product [Notodromas monacha]|uniref:Guanylate cyclase soluble subunit beta-1 n=1 Tax=Notodromas monacha TaxID=399045 RepID=A0A7R9GGM6_9CRUS|nr:unnamed protein product [Notodromas monacha]CAG0920576.1 unnamed protein product [Notodromas monacha]